MMMVMTRMFWKDQEGLFHASLVIEEVDVAEPKDVEYDLIEHLLLLFLCYSIVVVVVVVRRIIVVMVVEQEDQEVVEEV